MRINFGDKSKEWRMICRWVYLRISICLRRKSVNHVGELSRCVEVVSQCFCVREIPVRSIERDTLYVLLIWVVTVDACKHSILYAPDLSNIYTEVSVGWQGEAAPIFSFV